MAQKISPFSMLSLNIIILNMVDEVKSNFFMSDVAFMVKGDNFWGKGPFTGDNLED